MQVMAMELHVSTATSIFMLQLSEITSNGLSFCTSSRWMCIADVENHTNRHNDSTPMTIVGTYMELTAFKLYTLRV